MTKELLAKWTRCYREFFNDYSSSDEYCQYRMGNIDVARTVLSEEDFAVYEPLWNCGFGL